MTCLGVIGRRERKCTVMNGTALNSSAEPSFSICWPCRRLGGIKDCHSVGEEKGDRGAPQWPLSCTHSSVEVGGVRVGNLDRGAPQGPLSCVSRRPEKGESNRNRGAPQWPLSCEKKPGRRKGTE